MTTRAKALSIAVGGILAVVCAQAQRKGSGDDAAQKEIHDYVLTTDKLQRLAAATKDLGDLAKKHPELNSQASPDSLDETVKLFEKYPDAVAVVSKQGFKSREYIVGTMCMMQAGMAVGFKKAGTYKDYPPDMLKLVSKANLDFVEQHWDEFQKLAKMGSDEK